MSKEIIFDNKCPRCNAEELDYDSMCPVDSLMKQHVVCKKCDYSFDIWSKLNWTYTEWEDELIKLQKENKELRHAICDDDSITDHEELLEFASDLRDAYEKISSLDDDKKEEKPKSDVMKW